MRSYETWLSTDRVLSPAYRPFGDPYARKSITKEYSRDEEAKLFTSECFWTFFLVALGTALFLSLRSIKEGRVGTTIGVRTCFAEPFDVSEH
jgi:hypothetical protein